MNNKNLFQMDGFPIQQNRVYSSVEDAISCPKGSIKLVQDQFSGLIFNSEFNPELILYDENYQNEQGYSIIFQEHLQNVLKIITFHFKGKKILEIGCGKANFLELLQNNNFDVIGVDPAYEGSSSSIVKASFSHELGIKADVIILRHVLEHIPNPFTFLQKIAESNGNKGQIYIEVPCFEWIVRNRAWFDIYYEHVNYFKKIDFLHFFDQVIETGYLFGGQYLYVVADLSKIRIIPAEKILFNDFFLPEGFFEGINRVLSSMKTNGKNVVWGASSKGVIFSYYSYKYGGVKPDFIIDINPVKQGKYIPATGVKILKPEDAIRELDDEDKIFIVNSNYFDEIKSLAGEQRNYYLVDCYGI